MRIPNPLEMFLWTFRRNERDVINLYDYLSDIMRLATGGGMLNFGYWKGSDSPIEAQNNLCMVFSEMAGLESGQNIVDVGSGYGWPAELWQRRYDPVDITCVNINPGQLRESKNPRLINATATALPLADGSADRVLAFESAQHFRPLEGFVAEAHRVLAGGGVLALAIPVMAKGTTLPLARLGLLSVTWSSEHYTAGRVLAALGEKFQIAGCERIGTMVYEPLADYYNANRTEIRQKISREYPGYVERILHESINRMRAVSRGGVIDYLMVACKKPHP